MVKNLFEILQKNIYSWNLKWWKRTKQPLAERPRSLLVKFPTRKVKQKLVFQDEKDFTLQVPASRQNKFVCLVGWLVAIPVNKVQRSYTKSYNIAMI